MHYESLVVLITVKALFAPVCNLLRHWQSYNWDWLCWSSSCEGHLDPSSAIQRIEIEDLKL